MNANYRLKTLITLVIVALVTGSCAAREAYKKGTKAETTKDYEAAMEQYRQAMIKDPTNIEYKLKYEQTRFTAAFEHFQKGRRALAANDANLAKTEFERAIQLDPSHDFAQQELKDVERLINTRSLNQTEPILDFEKLASSTATNANLGAQMKTNLTERLNFRYTNTANRTIFENLATQAGLQVIFPRTYPTRNSTVELQDVNIFEALDLVSLQTGSFWQPVNETTIMVMEDTQQNRRDFEDHVYKTIYLQNITSTNDLNQIMNVLRTAFSLRGIYQFEPGNAIVIHDTPARVALVEKLIRALDKAKAEVVVEATVMEVDRNLLRDLGILPPGETRISVLPPGVTPSPTASNAVPIRDLNNLNSGSFSVTIPDAVARFLATSGTAKLLQNPRIRTTDGVTASLRVGSEVPVPTTSFQSTNIGGGATTAYTLQQVGVQLDIVSRALLTRDISLQVTVTVRALAGDRLVGDLLIPVFSNRIVAHTIRLAEGETNILGGIISETETVSITGIPGLKDIPLLKFIFGQEHKTRDQAEVIIMLTPHIVRMPDISEDDLKGIIIGSETNLKLRPDYGSPTPLPLPAQPAQPNRPPAAGASVIPPVPTAPPPATTASVAFTSPVTLSAGGPTAVNVSINGPNILGTDLTLSYDPSAFSIKDVRAGEFLSKDGQVVALVHNIDNKKGTATVSLERAPTAPLVSGSGTLLTVVLEPGTKKGPSPLRVTSFGVRDARSTLHPGSSAEVQITVP
jgi:general secretion pathway protein D